MPKVANIGPGGAEFPANANGTNFYPGGVGLVGEEGPELVNLPRGSRITPAAETAQALGGTTITIHVDARGSNDPAAVEMAAKRAVKEALKQAGNRAQLRALTGSV